MRHDHLRAVPGLRVHVAHRNLLGAMPRRARGFVHAARRDAGVCLRRRGAHGVVAFDHGCFLVRQRPGGCRSGAAPGVAVAAAAASAAPRPTAAPLKVPTRGAQLGSRVSCASRRILGTVGAELVAVASLPHADGLEPVGGFAGETVGGEERVELGIASTMAQALERIVALESMRGVPRCGGIVVAVVFLQEWKIKPSALYATMSSASSKSARSGATDSRRGRHRRATSAPLSSSPSPRRRRRGRTKRRVEDERTDHRRLHVPQLVVARRATHRAEHVALRVKDNHSSGGGLRHR